LTAAETRWKRPIVRWTAPKGLAALTLFFVLTVILELLLVYSFLSFGMIDQNLWITTALIPYSNWAFRISISPLFHLLPLSVIAVLLSSWGYLTKYTAFIPQRVEPAKRTLAPTRRKQEGRRFKSVKHFFKRLNRRLQSVGRGLKAKLLRIPGVSYASRRLLFARAAARGATTVLMVFLSMFAVLILVEYPDLIRNLTISLYINYPALSNLVLGTTQWLRGVSSAVPPLGGLGTAINKALIDFAPSFRRSLEGVGTSLTQPIVQLDVVAKYVLIQNLAAWVTALVALAYGAYASSRPSRRPKGAKK